MDGTPQRKKARFSEHPQVFQYSSRSKREEPGDNDSLLLDSENFNDTDQKKSSIDEDVDEMDSHAERQLQIDQITSDLAEIEAYLHMQSRPPQQNNAPTAPSVLTPQKQPRREVTERNQRFSININPQLRSGRETMSYEQELKFKSAIKDLPSDISNNKKRAMNEQNKERTVEERIQNEIKKNQRITIDASQLLNMLNEYKSQFDAKKLKNERKNRITMDVFALTKLIQTAAEDEEIQDKNTPSLTPTKKNQKSERKSKVFSAFKKSPHEAEVRLFVNSYLADVGKRVQQKNTQNKKVFEYISQLKSQIVKMDLKISDTKKRVEKGGAEKAELERKLKLLNQELNKRKYLQDNQAIKSIQSQLGMKILKFDVNDEGCYGHFIFDDIFVKVKSKSRNGPTELKFMIPQEVRENQKFFLISTEDATNLLKRYHSNLLEKVESFLETVIKIRKAYTRIKKLDRDLYYFSLNFELKQFELSTNMDRLNFQVSLGGNRTLIFQTNMNIYLSDELDSKSIAIYDPNKATYFNLQVEIKEREESMMFEKMKKLVSSQVI